MATPRRPPVPAEWSSPGTPDDGERRPLLHQTSQSDLGRTSDTETEAALDAAEDDLVDPQPGFGDHRRSSVTTRLVGLTDLGGVNSIRSFTRSWQRAAGFPEALPHRPSFVFVPDQAPIAPPTESIRYARNDVEPAPQQRTSLLRQHLEAAGAEPSSSYRQEFGRQPSSSPAASRTDLASDAGFRDGERKPSDAESAQLFHSSSVTSRPSIFAIPPHLATPPIVGSFGSFRSYGSLPSDRGGLVQDDASGLWQVPSRHEYPDDGRGDTSQPILVREVEQDGKFVLTVEGQSTLPQTIFNSINALIGVGILSLPLALKYSGWICGIVALTACAAVTAYTSDLLARCMRLDASVITYSDLAYICFGRNARIVTAVIFTAELVAANVALVVLFADSLDLLFPAALTLVQWKFLCSLVLIPLNFMPLRLLSFTSIVGILSTFLVIAIVVIDGLIKREAPGSLREPAVTYLFPSNWMTLPLAYGLFLSPFSSHSVLPNIFRDMRHPSKFGKAVTATFSFTYLADMGMAIVGILMFGDGVRDEITSNIIKSEGYPKALTFAMCIFIAIIPLSKVPLNSRPLISSAEVLFDVYHQADDSTSLRVPVLRFLIRVLIVFVFLVISILFPSFDSILSLMGSLFCASISVVLPISFYLKLFGREISTRERIIAYILIAVFGVLSVVGTVFTIIPKRVIGAE